MRPEATATLAKVSATFARVPNSEYLAINHSAQSGLAITGSLTLVGWARLESVQDMVLASKYEYGVDNRAYRFDV